MILTPALMQPHHPQWYRVSDPIVHLKVTKGCLRKPKSEILPFHCKKKKVYFSDLWVGHPHFEHQLGPNCQRAGDILLKTKTKFNSPLHHFSRGRKYLDQYLSGAMIISYFYPRYERSYWILKLWPDDLLPANHESVSTWRIFFQPAIITLVLVLFFWNICLFFDVVFFLAWIYGLVALSHKVRQSILVQALSFRHDHTSLYNSLAKGVSQWHGKV